MKMNKEPSKRKPAAVYMEVATTRGWPLLLVTGRQGKGTLHSRLRVGPRCTLVAAGAW